MDDDNKHNFFQGIVLNIKTYLDTLFRLVYLSIVERLSVVLSRFVFAGILMIIFFLFFFFLSLSLGYYIAEFTGRVSLGFGVVALFYFVLLSFLYLSRNWFLKKYLLNFFVSSILKDDKKKDE